LTGSSSTGAGDMALKSGNGPYRTSKPLVRVHTVLTATLTPFELAFDSAGVGRPKPERELERAHVRYRATVRAFLAAQEAVTVAGIPLSTDGRPQQVPRWTREHVQAAIGMRDAWAELVVARYEYDGCRRDVERHG
jgi:hypothetical protein